MRKIELFMWYDKIDKSYEIGSAMFGDSRRKMLKGFIKSLQEDKYSSASEYELAVIGSFDDFTGKFVAYDKPEILNVKDVLKPIGTSQEVQEEE